MFTLYDRTSKLDRRRLLSVGGLTLAGTCLPTFQSSAADISNALSGRSVIFLFQQGGPSQFETFDPKTEAPQAIRTVTEITKTATTGVWFGEAMSRLAKLSTKLDIVRSFHTNNAGHNIKPIVGPDSFNANIGAHYARVAGSTRAHSGAPTNAILYPQSVDTAAPKPQARGNLSATGPYSSAFVPFVPGAGGTYQANMSLNLPAARFDDRRAVLRELDNLYRTIDAGSNVEAIQELRNQAYDLLDGGGVAKALDLSTEDPKTVARYDTSTFAKKGQWDKVNRGRRGYYTAQARTIGKLLLVARRLCEAGCGFVTIHAGYAGVWDMHADGNNLNMVDGMDAVGRSFDHAVAAFVEDLEARGLRDKILLVATGEMGRTPRINQRGGRDHWAKLAPLLFYGGGYPGGQVIGRSTRDGGEPDSDGFGPKNLISTIMNTLFDQSELRLLSGVPNEVLQLIDEKPIPLAG